MQASQSDYVEATVCAHCHRDIAATYSKTGMGRSFFVPSADNVVEDYVRSNTVFHQASGLRYTMFWRNGEFFMRRSDVGFDGKEADSMGQAAEGRLHLEAAANSSDSEIAQAARRLLVHW